MLYIISILSNIRALGKGLLKTISHRSLFFVVGAVVLNVFALGAAKNNIPYQSSDLMASGGPIESTTEQSAVITGFSSSVSDPEMKIISNESFDESSVIGISDPLTNIIDGKSGLRSYRIKRGDTLSEIAQKFNITNKTVKSANPSLKSTLKPGMDITILPVDGALYSVSPDDSIESISSKYGADQNLIKTYNPAYQEIFTSGKGLLILPYVNPSTIKMVQKSGNTTLPDLGNYFSLPVAGWNWGQLHDYNAVDIANSCGTQIVAAADGVVVQDKDFGDGSSGWNGGYGIFILLEHPNGTKTRYAHLSKALVKIGTPVLRGEKIGLIGNTGNTHGPTGCHLHFEVIGAKNPFVLK